MKSVRTYLLQIESFLDSKPECSWIDINKISKQPKKFIEAVKFLIDCGKPYEFNSNYTKVRRINNDTSSITAKPKAKPARAKA